ncbi:hypothetical protein C7212DRAFT_356632 [Tuber magnatum]|uniref:Uncharacterized protein n=1 Tax=Tuber magnatum TaxID=42249 RepID=A0A317SZD3_9PEZI|nr:hypothetical protein C7212DRAFT_356632 [Tuber magnatum]
MAEPEKPTLLQSIRRYTNAQISSALHSLIGLPSMIQPPTFSDMDTATSTLSQPTTSSSEEPQQAVVGRGDSEVERMISEEWKTMERQPFLRDPEEVFNCFLRSYLVGLKGMLAEETFWPRSGFGDVWAQGVCRSGEGEKDAAKGEGEVNEETELDAYAQLLPLSTRPGNKTGGAVVNSGGRGNIGVVSSVATTRSVTINGATKAEYILKRRFSDGQEEVLQKRVTRSS